MKYLLLLVSLSVQAQTSFIVPLATDHIGQGHYNESNHGIGIEYTNNYTYSLVYLERNSYNQSSTYLTVSKHKTIDQFKLSIGLTLANGYENTSQSGYLLTPIAGIQYKSMRLVTTYPAGKLACKQESCADFINLQYIHKF